MINGLFLYEILQFFLSFCLLVHYTQKTERKNIIYSIFMFQYNAFEILVCGIYILDIFLKKMS